MPRTTDDRGSRPETGTLSGGCTRAGKSLPLIGNRYRKLKRLGGGAMGEVFLVEDTHLQNDRFTLKYVWDGRDGLIREARAAMKLSHPNIASVRGVVVNVEKGERPYLLEDYIDGMSLERKLEDGPLLRVRF